MSAQPGVRACAHGEHLCRVCDRYWWHSKIAKHIEAFGPYNTVGIAGNVGMGAAETEKYARQMIEWGELVEVSPLFDYPALWVGLAP